MRSVYVYRLMKPIVRTKQLYICNKMQSRQQACQKGKPWRFTTPKQSSMSAATNIYGIFEREMPATNMAYFKMAETIKYQRNYADHIVIYLRDTFIHSTSKFDCSNSILQFHFLLKLACFDSSYECSRQPNENIKYNLKTIEY